MPQALSSFEQYVILSLDVTHKTSLLPKIIILADLNHLESVEGNTVVAG